MFLRLQTQWSVGGMGGFLGLRYESVDFVFRTYKIKNKKEVLEGLQVMELAAMRELNKEKS